MIIIAKYFLLMYISRNFLLCQHAFRKVQSLRKIFHTIFRIMMLNNGVFVSWYISLFAFPTFYSAYTTFFLLVPRNIICLPTKTHILNSVFNCGHHWFLKVFGIKMFSADISITDAGFLSLRMYTEKFCCVTTSRICFI